MNSSRLLAASAIIAVAIIIGFALSIPHARDGGVAVLPAGAPTTTPVVAYRDAYRRGIHTITGSVLAPNSCTLVTATATPITTGSSTSAIRLTLSMPADQGVCLQLPSTVTFSVQVKAPQNAPITATINGALASTSTSTPS